MLKAKSIVFVVHLSTTTFVVVEIAIRTFVVDTIDIENKIESVINSNNHNFKFDKTRTLIENQNSHQNEN